MTMKIKLAVLLVLATINTSVWCQSPNPFLGKWKVLRADDMTGRGISLVIDESGGSWQYLHTGGKDHCVGLKVPILVESYTPKVAQIKLLFAQTMAGCPDHRIELRMGDDGKVTGNMGPNQLVLSKE
jgi:hypothetical protein